MRVLERLIEPLMDLLCVMTMDLLRQQTPTWSSDPSDFARIDCFVARHHEVNGVVAERHPPVALRVITNNLDAVRGKTLPRHNKVGFPPFCGHGMRGRSDITVEEAPKTLTSTRFEIDDSPRTRHLRAGSPR